MALPKRALSFLFLAIFLLSHHSQARDSQFFSKVTHEKETATPTTTATTTTTVVNPNNNNNNKQQEQEPTFIPDTQNNGYGLYGHEYGQLPPSDQTNFNGEKHYTTTTPTSRSNDPYGATPTTYEPYTTPVGPHYGTIEKEEEEEEKQDQPAANNFNNNAQLYGNNDNNDNKNYFYSKENNKFNGQEKQGMSDTRFLENGKYYHDNDKQYYNPNTYDEKNYDPNSYTNDDNKNYHYYGTNANNENSYEKNRYNNNNNNYNDNSFEGYQNQGYQENDNEFEP